MGVNSRKHRLPAPTESGTDTGSNIDPTDTATDLSRRTDNTSYSIPEDGSPLILPVKRVRRGKSEGIASRSQSSLLIEYYDGGKSGDEADSRPSVRVKVTPRTHKPKQSDDFYIDETGKTRTPSYTRRISLGIPNASKTVNLSGAQNRDLDYSEHKQTEYDPTMQETSDTSTDVPTHSRFIPTASDVSSMPPDSMLDPPHIVKLSPQDKISMQPTQHKVDSLLPPIGRSRSISRERITQKAIEKLTREHALEEADERHSLEKAKPRIVTRDIAEEPTKSHSRKSSRSQRDSGTESSLLRPRDQESNMSATSKVSINNPRLLQMVEDTIRRMILPEIETIKRQQSVKSTRSSVRDSMASEASVSRSKRDSTGESAKNKKHRHSSRSSRSEHSSDRRDSIDSIQREKNRIRRDRASISEENAGLTKRGLRSQDSHSSADSVMGRRERREHRSKGTMHIESNEALQDDYARQERLRMPMASELQGSDLTRESILSAETSESLPTASDFSSTALESESREVSHKFSGAANSSQSRNLSQSLDVSPSGMSSPKTARSRGDLTLKSPRSDRALSSKGKSAALTAAGLGGAAAAVYGHEKSGKVEARAKEKSRQHSRELSQSRSAGSRRSTVTDEGAKDIKQQPIQPPKQRSEQSLGTAKSSSSIQYPLTRKRHQGVNLETESDSPERDLPRGTDDDEFYSSQHKLNEKYRSSLDYEESNATPEPYRQGHSHHYSLEAPSFGKAAAGQQLQGVGANPKLVHVTQEPESAVASLLDPSQLESSTEGSGGDDEIITEQRYREAVGTASFLGAHQNHSADRWGALLGQAQKLSNDGSSKHGWDEESPRQSMSHSLRSGDNFQQDATRDISAEETRYDRQGLLEDRSNLASQASRDQNSPSILEGPLGDEHENRGHWPYEPTPPPKRARDRQLAGSDEVALTGAVPGVGLGLVGELEHDSARSLRYERSQSSASRDNSRAFPKQANRGIDVSALSPTQSNHQDEGYISAVPGIQDHNTRSPENLTPLSFSKPPPRLFDETAAKHYDAAAVEEDAFASTRHTRQMSGNSHGMPAEAYDAATGRGINNIESKDVVALMDHLTVRDGHRNARDTEILVTLVRSAAEMRSSFDDMKRFVEIQNQASINASEDHASRTVGKLLGARKLAMTSSPRSVQTGDRDDAPVKRKNIFQRALKGLGSKNEKDLNRMEEMLVQLLSEVELLRENQGDVQRAPTTHQPSLDSYERLRAAPESGYEPSGQAGTSSTPNHSGNLTLSAHSHSAPRMHSGYDARRDSGKRISTVLEGDEDREEEYESEDGLKTPTQEAQQKRSISYNETNDMVRGSQSYQSPPRTGERTRQKSISSSIFGVPKISRWSKTTTSSGPGDRNSFQKDRPYSTESRSGSEINIAGNGLVPYAMHEDDRLRSANSMTQDDVTHEKASSPLVPDESRRSMEDPKYKANRHSLTLQHPQPRQGPTPRHQSHLESQASAISGAVGASQLNVPRTLDSSERSSSVSPESELFGSVPALSRLNRFSGRNQRRTLSPISDGGYSAGSGDANVHHAAEARTPNMQARPPRIRDDGPLVPGPRALQPSAPSVGAGDDRSVDSYDSRSDSQGLYHDEEEDENWNEPIPLERKQSPYYPGALLAPIEERYSLEQSRISTPGEEEDERSLTPQNVIPRAALGQAQVSPTAVRKITGPREMPGRRVVSGEGATGLMGTLRRKPMPGDYEE